MPHNAANVGNSISFEKENLRMKDLYSTCACPRVEVSGVKHKCVWVKAKITQGLRKTEKGIKKEQERELSKSKYRREMLTVWPSDQVTYFPQSHLSHCSDCY